MKIDEDPVWLAIQSTVAIIVVCTVAAIIICMVLDYYGVGKP